MQSKSNLEWKTVLGAVFAVIAAPALADDSVISKPSFHVGIHAGMAFGSNEISDAGTPIANPPYGAFSCGPALTGNYCAQPFELDADGAMGGLQVGVTWRRGRLLAGVEGDFGWLGLDERKILFRPFNDRDTASVQFGWYGTLAIRLGVALDRITIYGKAGAALADIEAYAADIDIVQGQDQVYPGSVATRHGFELGSAFGGGLEYALNDRTSLRAEYLYLNFGSERATSSDGDLYRFDSELHTMKLGINFALN